MSNAVNEYITDIKSEDISGKNVIAGIDSLGRASVLIRNSDASDVQVSFENEFFIMKNNINLEYNGEPIGNYHVLICKKTDPIGLSHFERVSDYLFIKTDNSYSSDEMLKLFYSLETIFSVSINHDRNLEIGLYGELSVINYLFENHVGDLYKKWHTNFFNKHDFEFDENKKLEVKTTVKDVRIHSFRHNQVCRDNLTIYIASCMLQTCEEGLSLYDLCRQTIDILDDHEQMLAIELLMNKLGIGAEYQGICCIKEETYENLKFYDAKTVPHLTETIPTGLSNISYDIDFSGVADIPFTSL